MSVEADQAIFPVPEQQGGIICPNYEFDLAQLEKEGKAGAGTALIVLSPSDPVNILLALHNSQDQLKHGKWSFFMETQEDFDRSTLDVLSRLAQEEMQRDLRSLKLYASPSVKPFQIINNVTRASQYFDGKTYDVGAYVFWTKEDYSGLVRSPETEELKNLPLDIVLREKIEEGPLREFTAPILTQLNERGLLALPSGPLQRVAFPHLIG